jgi:trigger factor
MQVTETEIDELTRHFRVALSAEDIDRKVDLKLNELAHSARLPGFRPGKVPIALLRKRYGASVKNEVVEEAISETSQAVISERGLRIAIPPRVELAKSPEQGDLEFTMAVEVLPEITPPDYAAIRLERLVAEVDEEEIERRLRRFADAVGEELPVSELRPAQTDDIVVIDILGPEDKWPFDAEHSRGVRFRIGQDGPLPGFGDRLLGLSVGDRASVTITLPAGIGRDDLAGRDKTYNIEVKELRARNPVEIDDDLAKRGGWSDLEDMRNWLRQQHDTELKSYARLRLKRALLDRLSELYGFGVPKGLLEREYDALVRELSNESTSAEGDEGPAAKEAEHVHDEHCGHDHTHEHEHRHEHEHNDEDEHSDQPATGAVDAKLSLEKRREYRALAERRVRLGLVLAEIGRANNLRVTQEEIGKAMIGHARRFPGQEQAVLEFLRKNPQAQESLAAPILEDKVVDFILEMAQVSERTVAADELLRAADAETTSARNEDAVRS